MSMNTHARSAEARMSEEHEDSIRIWPHLRMAALWILCVAASLLLLGAIATAPEGLTFATAAPPFPFPWALVCAGAAVSLTHATCGLISLNEGLPKSMAFRAIYMLSGFGLVGLAVVSVPLYNLGALSTHGALAVAMLRITGAGAAIALYGLAMHCSITVTRDARQN